MSNSGKNLVTHSTNILRRNSNSWNVQATVAVGNTYTEIAKVALATTTEIRGMKISDTGEYLVTVDGIGAYRGHRLTPAFSISNTVSQGSTLLLSNVPFVRESVYFDFFNSGNSIYMLSEVTGVLTSTTLSNSYNILSAANSATYTAGNTWLRPNTTTTNVASTISSDGTDLLVTDNRANVLHYVLSQPGNLQTAALIYTWTPTLNSGEIISDVTFGTDNANVYLTCKPPSNSFDVVIRQYSLSTPKYINTASFVSNVVVTCNTIPQNSSLHFGSDNGNVYLYIGAATANQVKRGFINIYGDIANTIWTTANTVKSPGSSSTSLYHGIALSNTGTSIYLNQSTGGLYSYSLNTAWDINTINSGSEKFTDLRYRIENIRSCSFFDNGNSIIVNESRPTQSTINKIQLTSSWNAQSHIKTVSDTGVLFTRLLDSSTSTSFAVDSTGTNVYVSAGLSADVKINQFKLTTPWDLSTASYFANANTQTYRLDSLLLRESNSNLYIYGTESTSNRIAQYSIASNGDIRTLAFMNSNVMIGSSGQSYHTFTINSNNKYLYTSSSGSSINPLIRYDYNNSSSISSYNFNKSSTGRYSFIQDLDENLVNTAFRGMSMSPDGRKMFIKGSTYLYEYELSTPWEVSTAAYVRKVLPPALFSNGILLYISPNGRRAHTISGTTVYYATMGTPWDITTFIEVTASSRTLTAGALGSISPVRGIRMDPSGSKMIAYGGSYLIAYSLSNFDISVASYVGESYYNASLGSSSVYDFDVSPSGRVIFLPYPTTTGIGIRKYSSSNPNSWRPNDFYTGLVSTKEIAAVPLVGYGFCVDPTGTKAVLMDSNTFSTYSYYIGT